MDIKYRLELTTLNGVFAIFSSDQHPAEINIPREQWLVLGRPGTIDIEITAVKTNAEA